MSWHPWWLRRYSICLQCGRPGFEPWVGKIPWRRKWQSTPVLLPGKIPWTEEPGRLQSMGSQRVGHDWATSHALATVNSAAINTGVHISFQIRLFVFSRYIPRNEIAGSYANSIFSFFFFNIIYFWLCWVFIACSTWACHYGGFSCWGAPALRYASFSSYEAWAQ